MSYVMSWRHEVSETRLWECRRCIFDYFCIYRRWRQQKKQSQLSSVRDDSVNIICMSLYHAPHDSVACVMCNLVYPARVGVDEESSKSKRRGPFRLKALENYCGGKAFIRTWSKLYFLAEVVMAGMNDGEDYFAFAGSRLNCIDCVWRGNQFCVSNTKRYALSGQIEFLG